MSKTTEFKDKLRKASKSSSPHLQYDEWICSDGTDRSGYIGYATTYYGIVFIVSRKGNPSHKSKYNHPCTWMRITFNGAEYVRSWDYFFVSRRTLAILAGRFAKETWEKINNERHT